MLSEKVKNILFPPFSELDAIALLVVVLMPAIKFRDEIIRTINEITLSDFNPRILIILIIFLYWAYVVVKNALSSQKISDEEKKHMALFYFLVTGFLSMASAFEYLITPAFGLYERLSLLDIVNITIVFFVFIRSLAGLMFIRFFKSQSYIELITQVADYQMKPLELLLVLLLTPVFYFWTIKTYTPLYTILLTLFYTTTIIRGLRVIIYKS